MLLLPVAEEFDASLCGIPALIAQYEQHSDDFFDSVGQWLGTLEDIAEKYRLPILSELSLVRGRLLGDARAMEAETPKPTRKAYAIRRDGYAIRALGEAQQCVGSLFQPLKAACEECSAILRQVAACLVAGGGLPSPTTPNRAAAALSLAKCDPQYAAVMAQVIGRVGIYNAQILFDRVLPEAGDISR